MAVGGGPLEHKPRHARPLHDNATRHARKRVRGILLRLPLPGQPRRFSVVGEK
jgi:hypothetical protein